MKSLILGLAAMLIPAFAAHAKPANEPELTGDNTVHSYILLDRTGSMSSIWDEALSSVNSYASGLTNDADGEKIETSLSVAVFDAQDGLQFDVLRRNIGAGGWKDITSKEANPRGMTPLYDAIGKMVTMAEADNPEKAVIVIMTDGQENSSTEYTKETAKAALDRARARGWEVVFLGAEYARFDDAQSVGVSGNKSMAVGAGSMDETMQRLSQKSRDYGASKSESIDFNEEDRAVAKEEDVKERKGNR